MQGRPKIDKSTSTNLAKRRRSVFPVVRVNLQEVKLVVAVAEEYDMDVPGQEYGQSTLVRVVVYSVEERVEPLPETCMVEVERYCVILEN